MQNLYKVSIATYFKGEYLIQLIITTPCKAILFKGIISNIFVVLVALNAEKEKHFNVFQNLIQNQLIIEESNE